MNEFAPIPGYVFSAVDESFYMEVLVLQKFIFKLILWELLIELSFISKLFDHFDKLSVIIIGFFLLSYFFNCKSRF